MISTEERLKAFQEENNIYTKGPLSLVVQFTRLVQNKGFPLNPDDFQTISKVQFAGLGDGKLEKIVKEHGITQQLSAEGGRTSRGSMGLMIKYVDEDDGQTAVQREEVIEGFRNAADGMHADQQADDGGDNLNQARCFMRKGILGAGQIRDRFSAVLHLDFKRLHAERSFFFFF